MTWSVRVKDAAAWAFDLHRDQTRKASGVPYITHLWAVAALVAEYGGDEEQVIAALLHDAVEDQGGIPTEIQIMDRFGPRVAALVRGCSDTHQHPKPAWRPRKETHVLRMHNAPSDLRLLVAADKLHNLQATLRDFDREGIATLDRFNGGRDGTVWYYQAMLAALSDAWEHPILTELRDAVNRLARAAG